MTTAPQDTLQELSAIVGQIAGVPVGQVTPASAFGTDLGITPLRMVYVVDAVEDRWNIAIPDRDIDALVTVGDLADYITRGQD
jgi:acyl carrier protein